MQKQLQRYRRKLTEAEQNEAASELESLVQMIKHHRVRVVLKQELDKNHILESKLLSAEMELEFMKKQKPHTLDTSATSCFSLQNDCDPGQ